METKKVKTINLGTSYPWIEDKRQKKGYTEASQSGWYNTTSWRKLREFKLLNNPLCKSCQSIGRITPAVLVDHIKEIKGTSSEDWELFLTYSNLQSLCSHCHRLKTIRSNSKYSDSNRAKGDDLMNKFEN